MKILGEMQYSKLTKLANINMLAFMCGTLGSVPLCTSNSSSDLGWISLLKWDAHFWLLTLNFVQLKWKNGSWEEKKPLKYWFFSPTGSVSVHGSTFLVFLRFWLRKTWSASVEASISVYQYSFLKLQVSTRCPYSQALLVLVSMPQRKTFYMISDYLIIHSLVLVKNPFAPFA